MGIFDRKKPVADTGASAISADASLTNTGSSSENTGQINFVGTTAESIPNVAATGATEQDADHTSVTAARPSLFSVDSWREHILGELTPLAPSGVQLLDAVGLTLAESLVSDLNLPVVDTATISGFAIRSSDTRGATPASPVGLQIVSELSDLDAIPSPLAEVSAMKIVVGAPLPEGADTVLPATDVQVSSQLLIVINEAVVGKNVQPRGSELAEGLELAAAGAVLTPKLIGIIAETGFDKILVSMRPRVVVVNFSTNTVEPGTPLRRVRDRYASAAIQVATSAKSDGADVFIVNGAGADPKRASDLVLDQLIRADLIVTVGGLAADEVLTKIDLPAAAQQAVTLWGAEKQGFTKIGEKQIPWLMIPGDLVAAQNSYELFVAPVIRKLAGQELETPNIESFEANPGFDSIPGYTQCIPAKIAGEVVSIMGDPAKPLPYDYLTADSMVVVGPEIEVVDIGQRLECWMR